MSSSTNTLRTNEAYNGQRKSDSTSEGKPRVGAFFFINHGVENGSISSLSSSPTMYTDAEIMENRTDYPVVVDYALNIATSTHSSVSGLSEVVQKNPQQPRKLFNVFRRKASQAQEATVDLDCEAYPNMKSKDNQSALDNRINSTDPTIDIENQPSQEGSDRSLPIVPVAGEAPTLTQKVSGVSDLDLESIGFAGYINQNFSSNSPRRVKLFFMATCVFLLFAIGAVVAAITSGSNSFDKQANSSKQSVSLNQSPTPQLETTSSSSAASQTVDDAYVSSSTQAPAAHDSNDGAADISTASITSSSTITSSTASSTANSSVDSSATTLLTSTTAATASTSSLDPAASSSMSTTAAVTTASSTSATVTAASSTAATESAASSSSSAAAAAAAAATTTTTAATVTTASSAAPTVTAASSTASTTTTSSTASTTTTSSTTITVPAKLSSINLKPLAASNLSDKGKASFFRYDISEMLTNSLEVYKVVMRFQSNVDKKGEMITVEYLPKASNWNCNKCDETDVPSTNSITVGTFVLTGGESVYYMDLSPSFSKGIFGGQMTFKLSHSKRRRVKEDEKKEDEGKNKNDNGIIEEKAKGTSFLDPTLEIVFVDGNPDEFADLSLASLMEWIEWTEKVHSSSFVDRLL